MIHIPCKAGSVSVVNGRHFGWVGLKGVNSWLSWEDNRNCLAYIGRSSSIYELTASPLSNPYIVGSHGDRKNVVAQFKRLLWQDINLGLSLYVKHIKLKSSLLPRRTPRFNALVQLAEIAASGGNVKLVCWCVDKSCPGIQCHGHVIAEAIEWLFLMKYITGKR